jgi:hypothetical protein
MSGSKKGERRGAAGRQRKEELVGKPQVPATPRKPGPKGPRVASEDYYRQVIRFVNDDLDKIEPREMMLEAMRYFRSRAQESLAMRSAILEGVGMAAPGALTVEKLQEIDRDLAQSERDIAANLLQAADVAFKVAPFVHPRLSAIGVADGSGKNQATAM